MLRKLAADGRGIVYVSHRLRDILSVCTRLVVLRGGKVVLDCDARAIGLAELSNALAPGLQHRAATQVRSKAAETGLSTNWRGQRLDFAKGAITGLFGMAAGPQFELLEAIFGLSGRQQMVISGKPTMVVSPRAAIAQRVYFVSANRDQDGLVQDMSASDNLILPWMRSYTRGPFLSRQRIAGSFRNAVRTLNIIGGHADAPVSILSGGNRQKVFLGRWFFGVQPEVLLLSQPTQGVDVGARNDIAEAVRRMADAGVTVLVASSEADEVELMCDRAYVAESNTWPIVEASRDFSEILFETLVKTHER